MQSTVVQSAFTNASRFGGCDTSEAALDWVVSKRAPSAGKFVSVARAPTGFAAVLSGLARASSCPVSNTPLIDQDSHSNVIWPEPSFAARRAPRGSVRSAARGHQLLSRPLDHRLRSLDTFIEIQSPRLCETPAPA
jgi:hypothetical protein